jgi:hypothetical protein
MSNQTFYWGLLTLASAYVLLRGGKPERLAIAAWAVASMLSTAAVLSGFGNYETLQVGVFAVDLVLLAFLIWIALHADRFWPLWVTGFHTLGVMTHVAKALVPDLHPWAYAVGQVVGGYLIIGAIVLGTARHYRRTKVAVSDYSSRSSAPSPPLKLLGGRDG